MATQRLYELFTKWLSQQSTPQDEAELTTLLADPANEQAIKEILAQQWDRLSSTHVLDEAAADQIFYRVVASPPMASPQPTATPMPTRRPWLAAACIILLLGLATWLWQQHRTPTPGIAAQITNDVAPGGNKATLTLANGQKIILDSANNGLIAQQNGINIKKSDNNKLTYVPPNPLPAGGGVRGTTGGVGEGEKYNTLTTPRGGQYQLTLPDNSKVWLNAASSITYPTAFAGKERKVTVTGEAYIEVAKNAAQPFHVKTGDLDIAVLGTSFNINAYADEDGIRTTLIEGRVRVDGKKIAQPLEPGQQLQVLADHVKLIPQADVAQATAWKSGLFSFTDADLPTVMRQLARWYNVEVRYEGAIPKREFNGKIGRTLTLDQVLKILTQTRINYTIEKGNILTIRP